MRKILLVLVAAAVAGSFCFIHLPSATAADEAKTFTGKVISIEKRMGKPPKWIYAIVTVLADSGEKMAVYAIKATSVTDASGNDMNEGGKKLGALFLKKGERVEVRYATLDNDRSEASSIRCLD